MKAETYLQALLNRYGLIYGERFHLLDHIFSVIGNGFKWQDGIIVAGDEILAEITPYIPEKDVIRAEQAPDNVSFYDVMKVEYSLYPLCDSSLIFHIPEDVREDWLRVAKEWIRYLYMNRTETAYDRINDFSREQFSTATSMLEELASRYLHDYEKLKAGKALLDKLTDLANAEVIDLGDDH